MDEFRWKTRGTIDNNEPANKSYNKWRNCVNHQRFYFDFFEKLTKLPYALTQQGQHLRSFGLY